MLACVTALSTRSSVVVRLPAVRCSMPSERAAVGVAAGLILSEAAHDASSKMGSEEDTTGGKIWDSGRVLASVLEEEYASRLSGMTVLELGSGTGIGGLTAALAGATVTLTDGSLGVLPLLEANVRVNGLSDQSTVQRLRWGFRYRDDLAALDQNLDLVIGSDLLYSPDVFPDLLDTLEELCTPSHTEVLVRQPSYLPSNNRILTMLGCSTRARALQLCFPTRYTEGVFFDAAMERGFSVDRYDEREPCLFAATLRLDA